MSWRLYLGNRPSTIQVDLNAATFTFTRKSIVFYWGVALAAAQFNFTEQAPTIQTSYALGVAQFDFTESAFDWRLARSLSTASFSMTQAAPWITQTYGTNVATLDFTEQAAGRHFAVDVDNAPTFSFSGASVTYDYQYSVAAQQLSWSPQAINISRVLNLSSPTLALTPNVTATVLSVVLSAAGLTMTPTDIVKHTLVWMQLGVAALSTTTHAIQNTLRLNLDHGVAQLTIRVAIYISIGGVILAGLARLRTLTGTGL